MSGCSTLPTGAPDALERQRGAGIRSETPTDEIPASAGDPPRPAAGRTSGRASTAGDPSFLTSAPAAQPATADTAGAAFWESDPFLITGPAVISFSGGRTSAYMLHRIVQAHGGRLPDDVLVCFANTGREMPGTLDFVRDCGEAFGVRVRWLEFRCDPPAAESGKARLWAEEVSHNSASRNGEPFEALIRQLKFLPNPVSRFCTTELKIRTIRRWCVQEFGAKTVWTQVVGLRADEPQRVERILDPARQKKAGRESRKVAVPLAAAGITKADVLAFWAAQPFDLRLRGAWEGNCDGCFLKRKSFIGRLWRDHPYRAAWWARMEAETAQRTHGLGGRFRKDWRGGYSAIGQQVSAQGVLPAAADDDDGLDMFAACDVGCGA